MFSRLWKYIKVLWVRLIGAIICMAGVAGITTGVFWVMRFLIDNAISDKDIDSLQIGIYAIISAFCLKSILWYSHTYLAAYVGQSVAKTIRNQVYEHIYTLSAGYFNQKTSGGILSRLTNDVTTLQISLATAPTIIIRDGLTIIGLIGFLFYLNWKFALICFSILPIAAVVLTRLGMKSRRAGRESQVRMAEMYENIQEGLSAMPIVKSFQNEKKELHDFEEKNQSYFNVIMKLVRVEARSSPIMEVLGAIILCVMLWIGGQDVISGAWTFGSFASFIGVAMSLYNPIKKFAKVNVQLQTGLASAERIFQLLDEAPSVTEKPNAISLDRFSDGIEFKNVSFSYNDKDLVLTDVSFNLKKGDIVALVGPSGAGKSTIAQLLLRFYDPQKGEVLIDGHPLPEVTIKSLRSKIAVVTQETHLFNDSIKENIAYGKPGASMEEIRAAAQAAFADDFISKMPNGYETVIGERGTRLSGGERQRLAIARSLLKNPDILVLDEATSSLDAQSEREVQRALDVLLKGRTVLVIAHRLSTIRKATRIMVVEGGQIKETGNHDDLLKLNGTYQRLYELHTLA